MLSTASFTRLWMSAAIPPAEKIVRKPATKQVAYRMNISLRVRMDSRKFGAAADASQSRREAPGDLSNFMCDWKDGDWTAHMEQALRSKLGAQFTPACFARFAARFSYVRGDLQDVDAYKRLLEELGKPKTGVCSNIVFYLAVKPEGFGAIVSNLATVVLNRPRGLHRIDHYLAKESVQNLLVFRETPLENMTPNWILLSLQPNESMHLEIHAKQPGLGMHTRVIQMNAGYRLDHEPQPDAYESLLSDIIRGDATNFIRFDEVEWAWRVVDPILKFWAQDRDVVHAYPAGSWGPDEANRLFENVDQSWRDQV